MRTLFTKYANLYTLTGDGDNSLPSLDRKIISGGRRKESLRRNATEIQT